MKRGRANHALAQQFARVLAHSAFYQEKFPGAESITNREQLAALPFTEKDELRANFHRLAIISQSHSRKSFACTKLPVLPGVPSMSH